MNIPDNLMVHLTWVCVSVLISLSFSDPWHALTWASDLPSWAVGDTGAGPQLVRSLPLTTGLVLCSCAALDATVGSFVLLEGRTVLLAVGSGVWSPLLPALVSDTLTLALSEFWVCLFFIPLFTPRSGLLHFWSVGGACSSGLLEVLGASEFNDLHPFSLKMLTGSFFLLFWEK